MPVSLAALVRQPALGLSVVAGHEALDRDISWVHASELVDPTPYLERGALLLSVGLWLGAGPAAGRTDGDHVRTYVQRLIQAGTVGLGFGTGLGHDAVPEPLIEAASAGGLPVIEVPERTPFIALTRAVWDVLAADQYAEATRASRTQQELTRAAVNSGAAGLVRRIAERIGGWVVLMDAAGAVTHAAPAGAARQGPWLARELERLRDVNNPVSATLSIDGDQIIVQSLRPDRRTRGFLAVGIASRPTPEQRSVLSTGVSLLTLMLAQAAVLRTAESRLRTVIFDLLTSSELHRAARLATDLWGGLPRAPVRLLLVAGRPASQAALAEVIDAMVASSGERALFARVADRTAVVYSTGGRLRDRVLAAAGARTQLMLGESADAELEEVARAHREADQALQAGLRTGRRFTAFADIGASGLFDLLATPQARAFAESLLRPLIDHDAAGRGDLVRSLGAWLEHNGQWDAAAAALGVHRHTLRHRMRRVEELLGRDLGSTAIRMELWAGVQLLNGR
ncbi:MAG TPA: PucR family transcriptional regulator [Pilimelia sp.]|nr:PucR family transcriptional regulator [Pilimelia sp.]